MHPVPAAAFLPHTSLSPPVRWGRRPHGYESWCLEEQKVQKVPHTCVFAWLLGSGPGILRIRLGQNCLSVQRRRECLRGGSEKRGSHRLIQVTPGSERGWASPQATPLEGIQEVNSLSIPEGESVPGDLGWPGHPGSSLPTPSRVEGEVVSKNQGALLGDAVLSPPHMQSATNFCPFTLHKTCPAYFTAPVTPALEHLPPVSSL